MGSCEQGRSCPKRMQSFQGGGRGPLPSLPWAAMAWLAWLFKPALFPLLCGLCVAATWLAGGCGERAFPERKLCSALGLDLPDLFCSWRAETAAKRKEGGGQGKVGQTPRLLLSPPGWAPQLAAGKSQVTFLSLRGVTAPSSLGWHPVLKDWPQTARGGGNGQGNRKGKREEEQEKQKEKQVGGRERERSQEKDRGKEKELQGRERKRKKEGERKEEEKGKGIDRE